MSWHQFLKLKRFLELFVSSEEECQDLWLKAIDNRGISTVEEADFLEFIENLARGCMNAEPTSVSKNFAIQMFNMLKTEGCVKDSGKDKREIDINKLRIKVKLEKAINIEVFNQLLRQNVKIQKTEELFKPEMRVMADP